MGGTLREFTSKDDENKAKKDIAGSNVWTVNVLGGLEQLYDWGCAGIITNYLKIPVEWLKNR